MTAFLGKQIEEQQNSHKRDSAQELAYAAQQQAQLVKWQQQEDQKSAFRKDAMCKLKVNLQLIALLPLSLLSLLEFARPSMITMCAVSQFGKDINQSMRN